MGFKLHNWFRRRRSREEKSTGMVLTVTEDTPADMLTGSMELLVQLPIDHHVPTQRVTVERSTAMMDLLVQIATSHKLAASSYTLQAIGERGLVLPHQPNTPIGSLDALQVKLLPKQGTFIPRKSKQPNQPFETTFRLQVHLPRNQLYVSRVSPKMNLGEILGEVCREKNLDRNKYELRHPGNHEEILDLSLSLQDYHLQEVTLYAKQGPSLGSALSSQDIMALQRQEERRRHQAKQSVFGFMFRKSKESSLSTDSLGGRSVSPSHSDETGRSVSPLAPPTRPQRKRRPAPNPPVSSKNNNELSKNKEKLIISHSRNSSDSSGYHEASVLSDNPDSAGRMPETLPRRSKIPGKGTFETRKLAQTSQTSKSLTNLAVTSANLCHANSNTSLSSTGIRKKRAAPQPPIGRPLSSAISTLALERIIDSEESLTSDMGISKPPSDIEANSKANSDIAVGRHSSKVSNDFSSLKSDKSDQIERNLPEKDVQHLTNDVFENKTIIYEQVDASEKNLEPARVKRVDESPPIPKPRKVPPKVPQRRVIQVESSASMSRVDIVSEQHPPTETHFVFNNTVTEYFEPIFHLVTQSSNNEDDESILRSSPTSKKKEKAKNLGKIDDNPLKIKEIAENLDLGDPQMLKKEENSLKIEENLLKINRNSLKIKEIIENLELEDAEMVKKEEKGENLLKIEENPLKNEENPLKNDEISSKIDEITENFEIGDPKMLKKDQKYGNLLKINENPSILNENSLKIDEIAENFDRKKSEISKNDEKNAEIVSKVFKNSLKYEEDLDEEDSEDENSSTASNSNSCAIISTIPKCCHLKSRKISAKNEEIESNDSKNLNLLNDKDEKLVEKISENPNKSKVFRSQSSFGNFHVKEILENNNNRGKISHPDNFNCALNPNFAIVNGNRVNNSGNEKLNIKFDENVFIDGKKKTKVEEYPPFIMHSTNLGLRMDLEDFKGMEELQAIGIGKADEEESPSTTDILLQKVSSTLSTVLPSPSPQIPPKSPKTVPKPEETDSTPNQTLNSQQDTSDYVSATGDDLAAADWEYQLPDPPSAFRDTSPDVYGYETITLGSTDAFKDPIAIIDRAELSKTDQKSQKSPKSSKSSSKSSSNSKPEVQRINSIPDVIKTQKTESPRVSTESTRVFSEPPESTRVTSESTRVFTESPESPRTSSESSRVPPESSRVSTESLRSSDLKKIVISELETKIENGDFSSTNKLSLEDPKRLSNKSTPKLAPVDNTLANFTITTYPRDRNVNIYENSTEKPGIFPNSSEERIVKTFATLSRSRSSIPHKEALPRLEKAQNNAEIRSRSMTKAASIQNINSEDEEFKKPNLKVIERLKAPFRSENHQNDQKSSIVHRSKSYIVLSNNSKYREEKRQLPDVVDDSRIYKSTSYTNLNQENGKNDELQSVQVLKSILPHLKNAQISSEVSEKKANDKIEDKSIEEPKKSISETNKTYRYTGPPAISLGSWSERPCINVQIKHDTDYKFGIKNNNKIGGKTCVNLNSTSNNIDIISYNESKLMSKTLPKTSKNEKFDENVDKNLGKSVFTKKNDISPVKNEFRRNSEIEKFEKIEISEKKTNFKEKYASNYVKFHTLNGIDDKPVITDVSMKKLDDDDIKIDRRPVNFKELTQTFGQVNLRNKGNGIGKNGQNRHSDFFDSRNDDKKKEVIKSFNEGNRQVIKRYTSVIGIHSQNNGFNSEIKGNKLNGPMPVVKGFKSSLKECQNMEINSINSNNSNNLEQNKFNVPIPPTMPIITGVTLKNSNLRPKSVGICEEPRDQLLESIRNFGRDKLRSVSTFS